MSGPIYSFFTEDHLRLDDFLNSADAQPNEYDVNAYGKFRSGLLKHIKMEETILFPALEDARPGVYTVRIAKFRLDHGALTALMVPPPSEAIFKAIRFILSGHNRLEEEQNGLYNLCDEFIRDTNKLMLKIKQTKDVPVLAHKTEPFILDATRRALERAGYNFSDFEKK